MTTQDEHDGEQNQTKSKASKGSKQPRLKKDGSVDKRSFSSAKNLEKGAKAMHSIIKNKKAKYGKIYNAVDDSESDDDKDDSDTEYFLEQINKAKSKGMSKELDEIPTHDSIPNQDEIVPKKTKPKNNKQQHGSFDDYITKLEELSKSVELLKNENVSLKENMFKQTKISALNSLSQKMLLKF